GVIHRDLKAANLLVTPGDEAEGVPPRVRVLDFGIARALGDDAVADLEGRRGLQENPWHPALRRQLELCGLCASSVTPPARRDGALSPVGLEPIGY
ncbi:MAG: hypothetical protein KC503_37225, partial [Myxococcales bacterium]|nr:hypothetical protein [Myxococcales bacterium]